MARIQSLVLAGFSIFTLSGSVRAVEFNQVLNDQSTLTFVSKQMSVPVEGKFKLFSTRLAFDPAKLQSAKAQIEITMSSIDAGSKEANDEVTGKDWFDVKAFPTAKFVSTAIKSLGGNRYEVSGPLTIKGKTHTVTAPFTFIQHSNTAMFDGGFALKRTDFGIGEGSWSDPSVVSNEVQIKFHVVAGVSVAAGASAKR